MKKLISLILVFTLTAGAVIIGSAATDGPLRFAVASDLHYNLPEEELTVTNEELLGDSDYWFVNRRAALENESGFIIDEFLKECAEDDGIQFVLIPGDLADNGKVIVEEHENVAEKLKAFEEESGKPVYVINGNHDASLNEGDTSFDDFRRIYHDFGYDEALDTLEGTCSYTADLNSKYRLIALDSCSETKSTEDGMTAEKIQWVLDSAKKAKADGKYPVLMMHHNILDHLPVQRVLSHDFIIRFHYTTAELFADSGIKIVLTGHEHCNDATSFTSAAGNKIYDFTTTSLTMYPVAYRVFSFSDESVDYETRNIESIDTEALTATVAGYPDELVELMSENFGEYARQFFKAGIQYRLSLSLTMEKIGIDEGEAFYNLVNTAVGGLTDILAAPLYGDGGLQEQAKKYNVDLPDSGYENAWDLATELVGWHYKGSEHFPLDSTEVTLLLKIVDYILLKVLSTVNDEVFLKDLNALLENVGFSDGLCQSVTKNITSVAGPVTVGEYVLLGIATPIIVDFTNDDDVDDNNGSIPGYGADSARSNISNISGSFLSVIMKIASFFTDFIKLFVKIFVS